MHDPTRDDTSVARIRRSDKEISICKALFVFCQQVRCHENLNMSINKCVCSVRDGVQMILPVGSHAKCLRVWVCLNIGPTTVKLLSFAMNMLVEIAHPTAFVTI